MEKKKKIFRFQKGFVSLSVIAIGVLVISAIVLPLAIKLVGTRVTTKQRAEENCVLPIPFLSVSPNASANCGTEITLTASGSLPVDCSGTLEYFFRHDATKASSTALSWDWPLGPIGGGWSTSATRTVTYGNNFANDNSKPVSSSDELYGYPVLSIRRLQVQTGIKPAGATDYTIKSQFASLNILLTGCNQFPDHATCGDDRNGLSHCFCNSNYHNCNNIWRDGCETLGSCPTVSPTPTIAPTATPTLAPCESLKGVCVDWCITTKRIAGSCEGDAACCQPVPTPTEPCPDGSCVLLSSSCSAGTVNKTCLPLLGVVPRVCCAPTPTPGGLTCETEAVRGVCVDGCSTAERLSGTCSGDLVCCQPAATNTPIPTGTPKPSCSLQIPVLTLSRVGTINCNTQINITGAVAVSESCDGETLQYRFRHDATTLNSATDWNWPLGPIGGDWSSNSSTSLTYTKGYDIYTEEGTGDQFLVVMKNPRRIQLQTRIKPTGQTAYIYSEYATQIINLAGCPTTPPNAACTQINTSFSTCSCNTGYSNCDKSLLNGCEIQGSCAVATNTPAPIATNTPAPTNTIAPKAPTATPTLPPCESLKGVCVDWCITTKRIAGSCEGDAACCQPVPTPTEPCPDGSCVLLSGSCSAGTVNKTCLPLLGVVPRVCCAPTPMPGGPTCSAAGGVCVDGCSGAGDTIIAGDFSDCTGSAGRVCCKLGPTNTPIPTLCPKPLAPTKASSSTSVSVGETVTLQVNTVANTCNSNPVFYQFRHQMLDGTSIGIICNWRENTACQFSYNQAGSRQWQAKARIAVGTNPASNEAIYQESDWSALERIDVRPKPSCASDVDCNNFGCLAAKCNTSTGACEAIANAPSTENKYCETIDPQGVHHPGACKGGFCLPGLTPTVTPTLPPCELLKGVCVDGCIDAERIAGSCESDSVCCQPVPTPAEPCPDGSCVLLSGSCSAGTIDKTCDPLLGVIPRVCCAPTPTPGGPTCSAAGGVCVDSCSAGMGTVIEGQYSDCTGSAGRVCCKLGPTPTPPTTPCPGECVNPIFGCLGDTQVGEGLCDTILFGTVTKTCCVPKPTTSPPPPQTCTELGGACVDGCSEADKLFGSCTGGLTCCRITTPVVTNTPIPTPTINPNVCKICPNATKINKGKGDADCNGAADLFDFGIWRGEFLGIRPEKFSDFDCDGEVTISDFGIWSQTKQ